MKKIFASLLMLLSGCAAKDASEKGTLSKSQTELVNGYSQIYQSLGAFTWADELLMVKRNSKRLQIFAERVSSSAKKIEEGLEGIEKNEKWIVLDQTGVNDFQKKMFSSMTDERIKSYAPLLGLKGPVFERTLLLVNSGLLNQMKHAVYVLIDVETDEQRLKFLNRTKQVFEELYDFNVKLLNKFYFKHDKFDQSAR